MKNIFALLFVIISLSLSAQDCLNFPDTTFVCGFYTVLPTTDFAGSWDYLCDESAGTVAIGLDADGNTEVKISDCGAYFFSFSAASPDCMDTDTIMIYFDDPSSSNTNMTITGQLEYDGDFGGDSGSGDCPTGGSGGSCGGPATINVPGGNANSDGPTVSWVFDINTTCSATNFLTEVINPTADNCEAEDILLTTIFSQGGDLEFDFNPSEEYVNTQLLALLDSLETLYLDSLSNLDCQILNSCPGICVENPDMFPDTTIYDTIQYVIPRRVGGAWSLIMDDTCMTLQDTTVFDYFSTTLRLIALDGVDNYGPGSLDWLLHEGYVFNNDTTFYQINGYYELELLWKDTFEYDTIIDIREYTITSPDVLCLGCGGNSISTNHVISPLAPTYDCGPVPISFSYDLCYCEPTFFYPIVHNDIDCNEPCATVSFEGDIWSSMFYVHTPSGETITTNSPTFSACEIGNYDVEMITGFGCYEFASFTVEGNFDEFESSFDAEVCEGGCYEWNGDSYCESGTYQQTLQAEINGCDSIVTLNLIVNPAQENFEIQQVCSGETYNGYPVGEHTIEDTDANGCMIILYLTILENTVQNTQESQSICNGECANWNGLDYCESGTYINTIQENGCTVIQELFLTVTEATESFQTEFICPGEDYLGYSEGEYTINDTDANGCNSTLYLTIIENTVQNTQESQSICSGECANWNGLDYCESGTYINTIQENGCTVTQELVLTIEQEITYEISVSNDIDCDNENATLTVPNQTGIYQWSTGETGNSITVDAAGDYSVTYISENACAESMNASVEEFIENTVLEEILYLCPDECIMVNGQEICEEGMYTNVVGEGLCTTTFISEVRQMYAEITPTIIPSLDCDNNQGTLYLAFNNVWSAFLEFTIIYPDGNVVQTTEMPLVNNITQGGTYQFIGYYYSANGSTCETSLDLEIEDNSEQIEVSMSGNPEINCLTGYTQPETSVLNGYNYQWSGPSISSANENEINPQLTEAGTYTLTVSNPDSGCSTQSSFTVLGQPQIEVSTAIEQQISCQTGFALPQTTAYSAYNYVWSGNGITGENINEVNPELSQPGLYTVMVTNPDNGCTGSAEFTVLAQNEITALIDTEASCEDSEDGQAIVTNVSGGTIPYLYSIDGENWQTEAAFTNLETGDYILQIQDVDNCETQVAALVGSLPGLPEIEVEISEFSICGTQEVTIDASVSSAENLNYLWSNGQTESSLTTSTSGDYEVEISNNCASETFTYSIESSEIDANKFIFVPNAFSPNDDAFNPTFKGYFGKEVLDYQIRIFDRWGNLVFASTNPEEAWDGSKNGQKLTNGVYIWQMMVRMEGCEEAVQTVNLSGDVLLFR